MHRAREAGAEVHCSQQVDAVDVRHGRAVAVRTAGGATVRARRAVIADTSAPALFGQLLPADAVPKSLRDQLDRFVWDTPVVKINYALRAPIPWCSPNLRDAGTVHLGADRDGLIRWMADLNTSVVPAHPFMLLGQMTTADPSRSPTGTESAWAYTHLPRGITDDASADTLAEAVDRVIEAHAPGFGEAILDRFVQRPSDLQASDANLYGGAVNGGTAQLFQQIVFRPYPGLGRAETPIERPLPRQRCHPSRRQRARRLRLQRGRGGVGQRRPPRLAPQENDPHRHLGAQPLITAAVRPRRHA